MSLGNRNIPLNTTFSALGARFFSHRLSQTTFC